MATLRIRDPLDQDRDPVAPKMRKDVFEVVQPEVFLGHDDRMQRTREQAEWMRVQKEPLPLPDIADLRRRMHLGQSQFAGLFGFPLATLRHWERGNRTPGGASLVLLNVIARHPRAVLTTVARYRAWRHSMRHARRVTSRRA